jgi:hypothetical protein
VQAGATVQRGEQRDELRAVAAQQNHHPLAVVRAPFCD